MSYSIGNIISLITVFEWYNVGKHIWQVINNPITRLFQIISWLLKKRSMTTKWCGKPISLLLCVIGWYLGVCLHNWFKCTRFGWILELVIASMLLAYKNMFSHVTNTLDQLYSTDLELCRYKLSSVVSKTVRDLDEYGICNSLLLSLTENFSDGILLPVFYYLIAGLPGLLLYKTSDLVDSMFGNFKTSNNTLSLNICKIDSIMAAFPCFVLIFISNLIKLTKNNTINMFDLLNPQKWSIHCLVLKIMSWLDVRIKTGGNYGKFYVIGKQFNNNGHLPNVIDVIRLKTVLCVCVMVLMVTTVIIKHACFECLNEY
ncbi:cobalamin biosynthesis protein [Candidatus Hodgkinia cicadicola]|uniref:Cobalamin biosynthesis protein n=1 Tax=Candidatus Hodgkinia cicadicola TaxID=573658 RepID=A0ABX4MET6_9HYPH|nr:cobalamin biosynthesis protein [Candidatus Hodgkinia cicadicola]PIM96719.1 cobalamin biosynthesis protein [Candidatus Hodgkinia cicadicola]